MLLDLNQQTILVTGGAGFMGSSFIRYLLNKPLFTGRVINLDALTYCGNLENVEMVYEDPRYMFVHGNILNQQLIEDLIQEEKITCIVHFAAETHVDRSITNGSSFLHTNIMGTCSLLEAVRKNPHIHFHHISTDEVYGSLGEEGVFTEDSLYQPNSPYSASKASSDHFVRAYAKTYGLSTTISHACNNYGPYQFPEKLIPFMIVRLLSKATLPLYGRGNNVRDWLYVEDHSRAIEAILNHGVQGEVYNIGSGQEISNVELIKQLIESFAEYIKEPMEAFLDNIVFVKDRPGHDFRYALDTSKIRSLGWTPQFDLKKGLSATLAWYLQHADWLKKLEEGEHRSWAELHYASLSRIDTQAKV